MPAPISFSRHFLLLAGLAGMLAVTSIWRSAGDIVGVFAGYGALHAAAVAASVRGPRSWPRLLLFIVLAAAVSAASVVLARWAGRYAGALPPGTGIYALLGATAAFGAVVYAALIKVFWLPSLTASACATTALSCAVAAVLGAAAGLYVGTYGSLGFAVTWWAAFSVGLWYRAEQPRETG